MSEKEQSKYDRDYYESRGLVRHTMILTKAGKERLITLAKQHDLPQVDIVEALLECAGTNDAIAAFNARKTERGNDGSDRRKVAAMLKGLSGEKLAEAEKFIASLGGFQLHD